MDIVVISLRSARERRAAALTEFRHAGLPFEFFDAVPGALATAAHGALVDERAYRLNTQRKPLAGELGCHASHRAVWQVARDRRKPLIVLEDDFHLLPEFDAALPVVEQLLREVDFVRLEPLRRRRAPLKRLRPIAYRLRKIGKFQLLYVSDVPTCLTGYAVSPRGAERLIRASQTVVAPVDKFLQRTWTHGVPVHALHPPIVVTSKLSATSTIGARRDLKSRHPALLLARAIYKGLGELRRLRFDRQQLSRAAPAGIREIDALLPAKR